MSRSWLVRVAGKEYGPFTSSQLKRMAERGRVLPETEVRPQNVLHWLPARRVRGLFAPKRQREESHPRVPAEFSRPRVDFTLFAQKAIPFGVLVLVFGAIAGIVWLGIVALRRDWGSVATCAGLAALFGFSLGPSCTEVWKRTVWYRETPSGKVEEVGHSNWEFSHRQESTDIEAVQGCALSVFYALVFGTIGGIVGAVCVVLGVFEWFESR